MRSADDSDFTEFVAGFSRRLLGLAYLLTWDEVEADNLLQMALERAYRRWPQLNRDGVPEAYVRQVLVSATTARWHRRRDAPAVDIDRLGLEPSVDPDDAVARAALIQTVAGLPADQRAVLVLRHFEGLSDPQTAAVIGRSAGAVKAANARAIARLRTSLPTGRPR